MTLPGGQIGHCQSDLQPLANERYRNRKIILSNDHGGFVVALHLDLVLRLVGGDELLACRSIGDASPDETMSSPSGPSTATMPFRSPLLAALTSALAASSAVLKACCALATHVAVQSRAPIVAEMRLVVMTSSVRTELAPTSL